MNSDQDYYRILGVLPDAEDVVVRAAYRALSQRYHPDKWQGDAAEAQRRMQDLNEAYAVLGDVAKRKKYDTERPKDSGPYDGSDGDSKETYERAAESSRGDWDVACEYFPHLPVLEARLAKTSYQLAFAFRAQLLEKKAFADAEALSSRLGSAFMSLYFGKNPKVIEIAREAIELGRKDVAKEINRVVNVLGASVNPSDIRQRLEERFSIKIKTMSERQEEKRREEDKKRQQSRPFKKLVDSLHRGSFEAAENLATRLGYHVEKEDIKYRAFGLLPSTDTKYILSKTGERREFTPSQFFDWVKDKVANHTQSD